MTLPDTMRIPEVAARLGMSANGAYGQIRRGEFPVPVIRLGRKIVVSRIVFERFLAGESTAPSEVAAS